jgi:hypothetical protein
MIAPRSGFEAAGRALERRDRTQQRTSLGVSTHVLAALGGAALMLLWLKVGGLLGLRRIPLVEFSWPLLAAALALGAVAAVLGEALWTAAGPIIVRALGGRAAPRDLGLVWSAAAFPQLLALVLLALDVFVVGPSGFTGGSPTDSLTRASAAVSVALAVSLALWSLFLFVRGIEVMAGLPLVRAAAATVVAAACLALAFAGLAALAGAVAALGS